MSDDLLLGVLESCSGNRGPFSFTVLQKQVGTHILPRHLSGTAVVHLHVKVFTLVLYHSFHINVSVWASFTSSKNFLTHGWSIWGPMTDLRTWLNSFKLIPDLARFVATALLSSIAVNAFLRCCRCWGFSFSAGLTPSASSLQRAKSFLQLYKLVVSIMLGDVGWRALPIFLLTHLHLFWLHIDLFPSRKNDHEWWFSATTWTYFVIAILYLWFKLRNLHIKKNTMQTCKYN